MPKKNLRRRKGRRHAGQQRIAATARKARGWRVWRGTVLARVERAIAFLEEPALRCYVPYGSVSPWTVPLSFISSEPGPRYRESFELGVGPSPFLSGSKIPPKGPERRRIVRERRPDVGIDLILGRADLRPVDTGRIQRRVGDLFAEASERCQRFLQTQEAQVI